LGFKLNHIWDLNDVVPLFRIPSCVLFAEQSSGKVKRSLPAGGLEGITFSVALKVHNCNLVYAKDKLTEEKRKYYYTKQGGSSAFTTSKSKGQNKVNPYKQLFKQGATIVPRVFYFIELTQENPPDFEGRTINIKTSKAIQADGKASWKGIELEGQIESRFVFRTALSKSILPFAIYKPDLVVLPMTIENDDSGLKKIKLHTAAELRNDGYLLASRWFSNVENIWGIHRTEKNESFTATNYLNWQNKLTQQNFNTQYLVIYNGRGTDACAAVISRNNIDLDFIFDHALYAISTNNSDEAYYLSAILNSKVPNELMKEFQSSGLFGARNVHKKILDIYYPRFDGNDPVHVKLAELSKSAHEKANSFIKDNPPKQELSAIHLGRMRTSLKKHLVKELGEIDRIVKGVIGK
jgi:hypothetical protein